MSDVYNPQNKLFERLQSLEIEVRNYVHKRDSTTNTADRKTIEKQIRELEQQIDVLRRKAKPEFSP